MSSCPNCNAEAPKIKVFDGLYKCPFCGSYFRSALPSSPAPKFKIISKLDKVKEQIANPEIGTLELSPDMVTFVHRVSERLAPLTGLNEVAKAKALEIQREIRRELTEVFQGKEDFNKWYDRTKTSLGLHHLTFIQILYDSLEGLKGPEAQELQQQYAQTLSQMGQA
mgnify:CR=1 FL=1